MKKLIKNIVMLLNREIPTEILVKRGMKVGKNFDRQQGCFLDPTHCYLIEIGDDVTMSIRVTLMAHDASTKKLTGYTRLGQIKIGNHVFIGANATILPGVTVGDYAVIGAGSVVTRDVPAGCVVAGVPARRISTSETLSERTFSAMQQSSKLFDASYRMNKNLSTAQISELKNATENASAFID